MRDAVALSEVTPKSSFREVAIVLGSLVLTFAAANLVPMFYLTAYPQNLGYRVAEAKWRLLADLDAPVQTLVVGDSTCNRGVRPEVLGAHLGGSAINLCTIGDMLAVNDAWMVSAYLARFGAPDRIVMVHTFDVWDRDDTRLRAMLWKIAEYESLWGAAAPQLDLTAAERVLVRWGRWLPLYTQNLTLLKLLSDPGDWFSDQSFELGPSGFMSAQQAQPSVVRAGAVAYTASASTLAAGPMAAANRSALDAILAIADRIQVPVYLANAPIYQGLYADPEFRRAFQRSSARVTRVSDRSARVHRLFAEPVLFAAEEMQSANHVAGDAARRYSGLLAEAIARVEGSPAADDR